jgi:hypothetical protein
LWEQQRIVRGFGDSRVLQHKNTHTHTCTHTRTRAQTHTHTLPHIPQTIALNSHTHIHVCNPHPHTRNTQRTHTPQVSSLELTAAEMAQAAADLVAKEREILDLRSKVCGC